MNLSQNNSTSRANITLRYQNESLAKAVEEAISPDNLQAPKGLEVKVLRNGGEIIIHVQNKKTVGTLLSTLDDLLDCICAAEKALLGLR